MTKYLNQSEVDLIKEVTDAFEDLNNDLAELKSKEFILDAYRDQVRDSYFEYEVMRNEMIDQIISIYGEGKVDLQAGTIEITE